MNRHLGVHCAVSPPCTAAEEIIFAHHHQWTVLLASRLNGEQQNQSYRDTQGEKNVRMAASFRYGLGRAEAKEIMKATAQKAVLLEAVVIAMNSKTSLLRYNKRIRWYVQPGVKHEQDPYQS